jgi:hypothetical protein
MNPRPRQAHSPPTKHSCHEIARLPMQIPGSVTIVFSAVVGLKLRRAGGSPVVRGVYFL